MYHTAFFHLKDFIIYSCFEKDSQVSSPLIARSTPPAQAHHPLDYSRVGVGLLEQGVRIEGRGDKPVFLALNLKPLTNQRLKKDQQPCENVSHPMYLQKRNPTPFPAWPLPCPHSKKILVHIPVTF